MKKWNIPSFLVIALSLALYAWIVSLPAGWWDGFLPPGTGEPLPVLIREGLNARRAAEEFAVSGVIEPRRGGELARWLARFSIDRRLRPGLYMIRKGTPWETARQLEKAEPQIETAMLVPGTDIFTFPALFASALSEKEMEALFARKDLFPAELASLLPESAETRMAFLLPETFHIPEKTGEAVITAASRLWWEKVGRIIPGEDKSKEKLLEMAIAASLIEREALWDEERPLIAGVINNRKDRNMQLQIDATVVYAWKKEGRTVNRVLHKDLEIDSPYNTYKIPGFPPAPICMPSLNSWLAVISPDKTEYLYYVAQKDGRHLFSSTYNGHLKNIRKVRGK